MTCQSGYGCDKPAVPGPHGFGLHCEAHTAQLAAIAATMGKKTKSTKAAR